MKIKELELNDRPRERMINLGVEKISDEELLAIILKTGTKNKSVKELSKEVLEKIEKLNNLENLNYHYLGDIKGLGPVKKIEIMAAIELGRRIFLKKEEKGIKYNSANIIYENNKHLFYNKKQEFFYCLYLDNKNKLIERKLLFMGTLNRSIVHPREIFREAYLLSASSFVCMHNHPSGDVTPSMEDVELTKSLISIGKIQGINLVDHLIMGNDNYYSFYQEDGDLFIWRG